MAEAVLEFNSSRAAGMRPCMAAFNSTTLNSNILFLSGHARRHLAMSYFFTWISDIIVLKQHEGVVTMKKHMALMLAIVVMLTMSACANKSEDEADKAPESQSTQQEAADETGLPSQMPNFQAKDINGEVVDNEIFKDSKLTMVNIWGTFCPPCVYEMPELQRLSEEMKDQGVAVVGIIGDTPDADNEEAARAIIAEKGVEFINIIPDDAIIGGLLMYIEAYPTSIFVDGKGNIVGAPVVGAHAAEDYKEIIEGMLSQMDSAN